VKAYVVGGAVRDELLGLPVADRDWVVVGATPEEMTAAGFRPVGRDFPVFLHPVTHEEYALARTERKSGRGYRGFTVYCAPEVTLEEDLARRDLTINAMARDEDGRLIDPFGGERDLRAGVLRHVSEAFAEDPVRILRVARFAARYDFRVADGTMALMRRMVEDGEVDHLVPERVWQELARGLAEPHPGRMFEVLAACGASRRLFPEIEPGPEALEALARAAAARYSVTVRFAVLAWPLGAAGEPGVRAVCERLRVPGAERDLALLVCRLRAPLERAHEAEPAQLLALLKAADAFRRGDRFVQLLAVASVSQPRATMAQAVERLERALAAAAGVDAGGIAREAGSPEEIARRLDRAREQAIAAALQAGA
jgi:tRNA nucleotidyltransferase (CCA-adding enzyme)